ncbi:MAG: replicative DNA helicase [Endozoicomonadaceae bacterium]|nr:replicative DNA helicase [Endozoicomonadaceae bacterium]MBE8232717.1 replicative DNA helicase [Endozoicomonadaceae bacterium]
MQELAPLPFKQLPHSIEAEQSILGSLMLDNNGWDSICDLIRADDFYHRENRNIFECIANLAKQLKPFDALTVSEELKLQKIFEACGGGEYLVALTENIPSISHLPAYVNIVKERANLRRLIHSAQKISQMALLPEGLSYDEIIEEAEKQIFHISQNQATDDALKPIKTLLKATLNRIDQLFNSNSHLTGMSTGFDDLDEMTAGLQAGDMIVVAARPSMGKTVFGMNLVESAMLTQEKKPVLVFSLEMPAEQLLMRSLASLGKINQTRIRTGKLEDDDWPKLASVVKRLMDKQLFIDDTPGLSPQLIRTRIRRLMREHGPLSLVMIDYLQLMQISGYKEGRINEISSISRALKSMAKEFNVPIVALSQLNRSLEQRPNKRPVNSDLRESGAIEQDADVILFIYRDEVYNPDSEQKGMAEIIIGKQRNGPIGHIKLSFLGHYARFDNLTVSS